MNKSLMLSLVSLVIGNLMLARTATSAEITTYDITPSAVDHAVVVFDEPNYVTLYSLRIPKKPLVLFLPGTNGRPKNVKKLLDTLAIWGHPVIGLEYDNTPAVSQVCPRDPDPECSDAFRKMRIFGEGSSAHIFNPKSESIVARVSSILTYLTIKHPDEGWKSYIRDGKPDWGNIIVSGFSQGAGMAAYLAKRNKVLRVVLFSGPWDATGPSHSPAPWLYNQSNTPTERWYAEYHQQENTTKFIANSYTALGIPAEHIMIFDKNLKGDSVNLPHNPFHGSTVRDDRYASEWRILFGDP